MLTEKMMEDQIADSPSEFLGERDLVLVSRQLRIGKYIFDLLFQDRFGGKLIVEIQRGTLDRTHTYKILDYYDEYREHHPSEFIDLMVVANTVPAERKKRLHAMGIAFQEIPESRFDCSMPPACAPAHFADDRQQTTSTVTEQLPTAAIPATPGEAGFQFQSLGQSAFVCAAREAIEAKITTGQKSNRWKAGGQSSLTVAHLPISRWLSENDGGGLTAQIWMERPKNGAGACKFEIAGNKEKKLLREKIAAAIRMHLSTKQLPDGVSLATGSTIARLVLSLPGIREIQNDSPENAIRYSSEVSKTAAFFDFLDGILSDWVPSR